jgi:hypothetical protein
MAEAHSQVLMSASTARATAVRRSKRTFYVGLSVFMVLLVAAGFWPSYYGPLVRGAAHAPAFLHFHGAIFAGWMALLVAQVMLAATGRIRAHRSVGAVGLGYGAVVWLMGTFTSFFAPVMHLNAGEWTIDQAAAFLPIPLGDMVLFGSFLVPAALYRRRPEVHKRLMLLATVAIVFAAVFRLNVAGMPMPAAIALWFVPVFLGMSYDAFTRGRVHVVYWIGAAAMALALLRLPLRNSDVWLAIGRPIFELLT